jgi:aspartyl/glutamyl-tRNA(Asn/Gln) amidotransferase C subunit
MMRKINVKSLPSYLGVLSHCSSRGLKAEILRIIERNASMIGMVTLEEVKKLASLSRLSVPEAELEGLRKDIDGILAYVRQIKGTSGLEETKRALDTVHNVMREDGKPHPRGAFTETLLSAAPQREGQYLKVKKIL